MLEMRSNANLFSHAKLQRDAAIVPINGAIAPDGRALMEEGVARYARDNVRGLDAQIGNMVRAHGLHAYYLGARAIQTHPCMMIALPERSAPASNPDVGFICQMASECVTIANIYRLQSIYLPPIGCESGALSWEMDVREALKSALDDRFIAVIPDRM